jgi:hypothetical protein
MGSKGGAGGGGSDELQKYDEASTSTAAGSGSEGINIIAPELRVKADGVRCAGDW